MAQSKKVTGPFRADFVYTNEILSDFEAFYQTKRKMSPKARIICGVIGAVGAIYFGYTLYAEGFGITRTGYLIACSLMLLVAFSSGKRSGADETIKKYRKYYTNRKVHFEIDEEGVEMKLEKQKNYARSKFKQIYGLYETDLCFYFVIKGKAYYIISKKALVGGTPEEFRSYMETHCRKHFLAYQV